MTDGDELDPVLEAWRRSHDLHETRPGLDENARLAAEARLGRELPAGLRRLYEFSDGFAGFQSSLQIESSLVAADFGAELADNGWPIPPEFLVFGGDGSGDHYALWYPAEASPDDPTPVIEIGEIFEPGSFAIVGTSLPRFLRTITAFHLAYAGGPGAAMDALGLPSGLRRPADRLTPFVAWSDPGVPFPDPDPYIQRLTVERVRDLLDRAGR